MTEQPEREDEDEHQAPRRREPVFNLPRVIVAFIGICVAVHLVRLYVAGPAFERYVLLNFAFIPLRYTGGFALDLPWLTSPLTYAFLHGGWAHLAVNMIWLAAFGSPLANRIGTGRFILFWIATVLGAVGLHFILHPYDAVPLVGASGAISGMMGAAARFAFRIDRRAGCAGFAGPVLPLGAVLRSRMAMTFLAVWMVVNLVVGLGVGAGPGAPSIAWEAHIGGFLVGFFFVKAFTPAKKDSGSRSS